MAANLQAEKLSLIFTCGGRLKGALKDRAPDGVKALLEVRGMTMLKRAIIAMERVAETCGSLPAGTRSFDVARAAVVGPPPVRAELDSFSKGSMPGLDLAFAPEGGTLLENIRIGMSATCGESGGGHILIVSPDLPFVTGEAAAGFLASIPREAELAFPVVSKEDFLAVFPGAQNKFNRLKDGYVTMGSVIFATANALRMNFGLFQDAHDARKNPAKLAGMLGPAVILKFLTGTLSIADAEKRISRVTGVKTCGVTGSSPLLAFDVDSDLDFEYAESLQFTEAGV